MGTLRRSTDVFGFEIPLSDVPHLISKLREEYTESFTPDLSLEDYLLRYWSLEFVSTKKSLKLRSLSYAKNYDLESMLALLSSFCEEGSYIDIIEDDEWDFDAIPHYRYIVVNAKIEQVFPTVVVHWPTLEELKQGED